MKTKTIFFALVSTFLAVSHAPTHAQLFGFGGRNTGPDQDRNAVKLAAASFAAPQADWAKPIMAQLFSDGEWGAVLNFKRLGLVAMERQQFPLARRAFDEAIARVEEIYANDANAIKARSLFNAESVKDFKGEPYERAMLYYYRGLLYVQEGDYQNARASFLAADRHITLSSAEAIQFTSDFGLMKYLAGWASNCDNDPVRAVQLIEEARTMDIKYTVNLPQKPTTSLVLVDSGPAPQKWGDGEYKHILKFKPGEGLDVAPKLKSGGGKTIESFVVAGDLNYQSTTRGGREVDGIMAGKAQFKDSAGKVGSTAMTIGSQVALAGGMSGNRDMANAGLAGMFVGLIAKGVESATNPAADIRFWDALPARLHVYAEDGIAEQPMFLLVGGQPQQMPLIASHGRCSIAWGRTTPATALDISREAVKFNPESNRGNRNKALRDSLIRDFVASK